ncbi:hypothetical protein [Paractinoplanes atraurantiacus]|uniref:Uncharacterized protein n=1 Tax=Paractinoplanes atraurantiacus TaxID=1036182 RepID=A0A285HGN5_9ACTN|nr:hypothetical protein [Actinoplanes atraurantiacus]SNY34848.1 hypothetical protein SAMN05421748_104345 [Actinoplanes atraurantiacus]
MSYAVRLHEVLRTWAAGHGVRAEVDVAELAVRDSEIDRAVHLYETAADELTALIELDTAARLGHRRPDMTTADELVLAALRIRRLVAGIEPWRGGKPHPRVRHRLRAALRRLQTAAGAIAVDEAGLLLEHPAVAAAYEALDEVLPGIEWPGPPAAEPPVPPTRDAVTLADQFLLVFRPGRYACAVHLRLFRPAGRPPVALIGELADYHSPGLLEDPGAYLAELRERAPLIAAESPEWVHYLPAEYASYSERHESRLDLERAAGDSDSARLVSGDPATTEDLSLAGLEAMVCGPVRRWHAADYSAAVLTGLGVRTVNALTGASRATHPEAEAKLRCRRWRCGSGFTHPVRTLPKARCPYCGGAKTQVIEVSGL